MKKKKQTPATADDRSAAAPINDVDIKSLVRDYAVFFDDLVNRIPAKFYLPTAEEDKAWYQGLSKSAKAAAKQKSIENLKKARRDRLDPEKSAKTTDVLKETLASDRKEEEDDDNGDGGRSEVTLEDLHQRLQKRIAELRSARGGGEGGGRRREERREKKEGKKRKRNEEVSAKKKGENDGGKNETEDGGVEKQATEAAKGIEFGKVKLSAEIENVSNKKRKKKKLSKEEELKKALELEEAKKDPEKGELVAKKHAWKAAAERAMGNKVHDNPKLLKQSLQKEKRKHKKSVEKWKQRDETTQKMKQEKQDKRRGNIKAKIDRKKQTKIEKREKKLMRPGFEGRKEGFVTAD